MLAPAVILIGTHAELIFFPRTSADSAESTMLRKLINVVKSIPTKRHAAFSTEIIVPSVVASVSFPEPPSRMLVMIEPKTAANFSTELSVTGGVYSPAYA